VSGAGKVCQLLVVLFLTAVLPTAATSFGTIIVSSVLAGDAVLHADALVDIPPVVVTEASLTGC